MKMRTILLYILTALLSVLSVQTANAQAVQDALYIFRNDGGFDAFFWGDINRIEYSKVDTLGVEHDDYVVQEVWALDTVYRIPINAIDSVSFVTPETKIKADVFCPDKSIANYIVASDSVVWIRLARNTPAAMIPKVGDKLFIQEASTYIPNGFVGLVTEVADGSDGITVTTDELEITDIFDRLVAKAAAATVGGGQDARRRGLFDGTEMKYTTEEPIEFPVIGGSVTLQGSYGLGNYGPFQLTGDLAGSVNYNIQKKMEIRAFLFVDELGKTGQKVKYDNKVRMLDDVSLGVSVAGSLTGSVDIPLKGISKRLSDYLKVNISVGMFFGAQFTAMSLDYSKTFSTDATIYCTFDETDLTTPYATPLIKHHMNASRDTTELKFNYDGKWSLSTGIYSEISLGMAYPFKKFDKSEDKKALGVEVKIRGELGGKLEYEVPKLGLSATTIANPLSTLNFYRVLNNTGSVNTMLYGKLSFSGELGKWKGNYDLELDVLKNTLSSIVPNITGLRVQQDQEEPIRPYRIRMTPTADRDVITPKYIGIAVYNEDRKLVADSLCDVYYREKTYKQRGEAGETGCVFELDPGKEKEITYYAYPMVEYMNNHLLVSDEKKEFRLDAARIDIAQRLFDVNGEEGYLSDHVIEVVPNMPNLEVVVEAGWLKKPIWQKHLNELSIGWQELPEDVKDRRGVFRLYGKSKTGEILVEDSIVVHQYVVYADVTPSKMKFETKGGTQTATITGTNLTDLKVSTDLSWVHPILKDNVITVTVDENKEVDGRGASNAICLEGKTPDGQQVSISVIYVEQAGIGGGTDDPDSKYGLRMIDNAEFYCAVRVKRLDKDGKEEFAIYSQRIKFRWRNLKETVSDNGKDLHIELSGCEDTFTKESTLSFDIVDYKNLVQGSPQIKNIKLKGSIIDHSYYSNRYWDLEVTDVPLTEITNKDKGAYDESGNVFYYNQTRIKAGGSIENGIKFSNVNVDFSNGYNTYVEYTYNNVEFDIRFHANPGEYCKFIPMDEKNGWWVPVKQ